MNYSHKERVALEKEWHLLRHSRKRSSGVLFPPSGKGKSYAHNLLQQRICETVMKLGAFRKSFLISPAGMGADIKTFLSNNVCPKENIVGLDVSEDALSKVAVKYNGIKLVCADILGLPFKDDSFDIVLCNGFFHHVTMEDFTKYISEFKRVLKKGGFIVIQEPSIFYPLSWLTLLLRKFFYLLTGHEPVGHLPHERPFSPFRLKKNLYNLGFMVSVEAASFIHNRFPIALSKVLASFQKRFYTLPVLKYFGWELLYIGEKK
jgi:SAM-dependent methyltransferase